MESHASKENSISRAPQTPSIPMTHSFSSLNYRTEPGFQAGYMRANLGRGGNYFPNSSNLYESLLQELEKQRIRVEILTSENRSLQEEVRMLRQMLTEREMAPRATYPTEDRLSDIPVRSGPSKTMMKASPEVEKEVILLPNAEGEISGLKRKTETPQSMQATHAYDFSSFLDPRAMLLNRGLPNFNHSEDSFNHNPELKLKHLPDAEATREMLVERERAHKKAYPINLSPPGHGSNAGIAELKAGPEVENETIMNMPDPEGGVSGLKRKAVTQQLSSDAATSMFDLTKKLNLGLQCEFCQVNVTSEQQMQEHREGKKHRSKVLRQPSQTTVENFSIGLNSSEAIKKEDDGEPVKEGKNNDVALQLREIFKDSTDDSHNYLFWCENCKFGASTEKAMDDHRRGKEHETSRLEK